jgi:hypothetical protein
METPPIKLAFIIDNEVADILHTDERLAAIFLSNPTIINVTEKYLDDPNSVRPGMMYDPESGNYLDIHEERKIDV